MRDVLLLVDLVTDFAHEDGERLRASYRERLPAMEEAIESARGAGVPVVYVNDNRGRWESDAPGFVRSAIERGGGELVAAVAPRPGDAFLFKLRYSAFDFTPLEALLRELETERLLLAGAASERCVTQTAIAARERGLKVTVLASASARIDERDEEIALEYLARIAGARIEHGPLAAILGR